MNAPEILYEDNHLIAVNKKPGDIVQGDKTGDKPMSEHLKDYVKDKFQKLSRENKRQQPVTRLQRKKQN